MSTGPPERYCVVDANALIRRVPLDPYVTRHGCKLVTTGNVLREIRDPGTRAHLEALPFPIEARDPSPEGMAAVQRFARLTGDIGALSLEDLSVIALAWTLERKVRGGVDHLRTEPPPANVGRVATATARKTEITRVGGVVQAMDSAAGSSAPPAESAAESATDSAKDSTGTADTTKPQSSTDGDGDGNDSDSSSDEGWITPSNIATVTAGILNAGRVAEEDPLGAGFCCGVLTADYAMQNVIMQMGMRVLAIDGSLVVRGLRRWVARCHACFTVSIDTERQFCEKCGNQAMQRCESTLDADGNVTVYVRRRPPTQRGHKYSIPMPKGGRHKDVILREDQYNERLQKMGLRSAATSQRAKDKDDFMDADHLFFTRGASASGRGVEVGFGRRNPNVSKKTVGKKKNKRG